MSSKEPSALAQQWARQYVESLSESKQQFDSPVNRRGLKVEAANRLLNLLRQLSLKAWYKTESILSEEIKIHQIDHRLINPWEISQDTYKVYEKALLSYTQDIAYTRLPNLIGTDIAKIREKYTASDPRVIAFVSMQFHYTGCFLKEHLNSLEAILLENCFKVIDDHLYMPLHRAYSAASKYQVDSPRLIIAKQMLVDSTAIAEKIVQEIADMYPRYQTYSGLLSDSVVMDASRRDAAMFQIYLIVCILEDSPSILQDELFPLCIMLYPKLKVHWEFVRQMLIMIDYEIMNRQGGEASNLLRPYISYLREMFSPEVFHYE
jgi:hypothetical protein